MLFAVLPFAVLPCAELLFCCAGDELETELDNYNRDIKEAEKAPQRKPSHITAGRPLRKWALISKRQFYNSVPLAGR